jgi:hypothetical protein
MVRALSAEEVPEKLPGKYCSWSVLGTFSSKGLNRRSGAKCGE